MKVVDEVHCGWYVLLLTESSSQVRQESHLPVTHPPAADGVIHAPWILGLICCVLDPSGTSVLQR